MSTAELQARITIDPARVRRAQRLIRAVRLLPLSARRRLRLALFLVEHLVLAHADVEVAE